MNGKIFSYTVKWAVLYFTTRSLNAVFILLSDQCCFFTSIYKHAVSELLCVTNVETGETPKEVSIFIPNILNKPWEFL